VKNFALIGVGGFVAPKHLKAIKETGNQLIAALDKFDSVGVIDSYFPEADFFVEFERFDRHLDKLKREGLKVDYVSICSPNYLHDSHIRFGLRHGADVICEKPLVLNTWNIKALSEIEQETGKKINNILQLRYHPSILNLKEKVEKGLPDKIYDVDLTYITSRGHWYYTSWKGQENKSGGIATNIGIHFFDMLSWIFGDVEKNTIHIHTHDRAAGYLELQNARVRWFLSINYNTIPQKIKENGLTTYRSLVVDEEELEFSSGFDDLHTKSYQEIIKGNGFGLAEANKAIEIVHDIRNTTAVGLTGDYHPFATIPLENHPFVKGLDKS